MRKQPRQARSRATVEAIVEAGARILGDRGWPGFTTNEVAERAGVSIGSLYQYFPNKLALIEAIRRRHFDDVLAVLQGAIDGRATPDETARTLIDGLIAVHSVTPALHRVLLDLPNPDEAKESDEAFLSEYLRRYRTVIAASRGPRGDAEDCLAAQVLSSAIEGVIHNAARRGLLGSPELRRDLVGLVLRYLDEPAAPA